MAVRRKLSVRVARQHHRTGLPYPIHFFFSTTSRRARLCDQMRCRVSNKDRWAKTWAQTASTEQAREWFTPLAILSARKWPLLCLQGMLVMHSPSDVRTFPTDLGATRRFFAGHFQVYRAADRCKTTRGRVVRYYALDTSRYTAEKCAVVSTCRSTPLSLSLSHTHTHTHTHTPTLTPSHPLTFWHQGQCMLSRL